MQKTQEKSFTSLLKQVDLYSGGDDDIWDEDTVCIEE